MIEIVVRALAAIWLLVFAGSFVAYQTADPAGAAATRALDQMAAFLLWQCAALVVAAFGALGAYRIAGPSSVFSRLLGYAPLAISVFLLVMLVAIVAFRVLVVPAVSG